MLVISISSLVLPVLFFSTGFTSPSLIFSAFLSGLLFGSIICKALVLYQRMQVKFVDQELEAQMVESTNKLATATESYHLQSNLLFNLKQSFKDKQIKLKELQKYLIFNPHGNTKDINYRIQQTNLEQKLFQHRISEINKDCELLSTIIRNPSQRELSNFIYNLQLTLFVAAIFWLSIYFTKKLDLIVYPVVFHSRKLLRKWNRSNHENNRLHGK